MKKALVHICSVLLLVTFIMKGLTGVLPLLNADRSDLFNKELLCSEPDTDQPTPGENKQV